MLWDPDLAFLVAVVRRAVFAAAAVGRAFMTLALFAAFLVFLAVDLVFSAVGLVLLAVDLVFLAAERRLAAFLLGPRPADVFFRDALGEHLRPDGYYAVAEVFFW